MCVLDCILCDMLCYVFHKCYECQKLAEIYTAVNIKPTDKHCIVNVYHPSLLI